MSALTYLFSIRGRHTRCALVTGVQPCALPILGAVMRLADTPAGEDDLIASFPVRMAGLAYRAGEIDARHERAAAPDRRRSEERRVGKEGVSTFRSRLSPKHKNKTTNPPPKPQQNQTTHTDNKNDITKTR